MTELFEVINIETHNICNRKCSFCKFGQPEYKISPNYLSINVIKKISNELESFNFEGRVHFTGINEPLIDKRIFEIVSIFSNIKAQKSITTNGDYLNNEFLLKLKEAGVTHLNISIYSDDHLEKINETCKGWNYGVVDMRPHQQRLYQIISNRAGSLDLTKMFDKEIVQIRDKLSKDRGCSRPFQYITVIHTGEVILCPEDMSASCIMGDLKNNSILEIWNNHKFSLYRETLKKEGRKNLFPCQSCNFNGKKTKEKGKELFQL